MSLKTINGKSIPLAPTDHRLLTLGVFEQGQRGTLPDFAGMDAEFFVQEAAGQVVHQDRAIAGAWGHETEREKKNMRTKTNAGEEVASRDCRAGSSLTQQHPPSSGIRVKASGWQPCVCPVTVVSVTEAAHQKPPSLSRQTETQRHWGEVTQGHPPLPRKLCLIKYCRWHLWRCDQGFCGSFAKLCFFLLFFLPLTPPSLLTKSCLSAPWCLFNKTPRLLQAVKSKRAQELMCAKEKKYWTAEKQRTAQQLPFLRKILESSWKSADVDHPLILGPARSGTRATRTEILMAAWGPRFTSGLKTIYVCRWRRCERGGAVGNLCVHQLRLLRRCTPETIRRVTAVTSRCARGDCVTSIAHTTGLYDDTTSSGLEERLEGWDTCQNKETFSLPFV